MLISRCVEESCLRIFNSKDFASSVLEIGPEFLFIIKETRKCILYSDVYLSTHIATNKLTHDHNECKLQLTDSAEVAQ